MEILIGIVIGVGCMYGLEHYVWPIVKEKVKGWVQ